MGGGAAQGARANRGPNGPRRPAPSAPFLPADFPVILEDVSGGFTALSPWERERLLSRAVPDFRGSLRRLPSGGWLVACADQELQGRVFRLSKLGQGIEVRTRRPRPVVIGVIRGLPVEEGLEGKVKKDLQTQGLPVDRVSRLELAGGEPSRSLRVSFHSQRLPDSVLLGSEEFLVSPFIPPVRRCTRCQALGHTKQRCRRKTGRCSRCGRDGHLGADCVSSDLCCVNCGGAHSAAWAGCPEAMVRRKAGEILSARYMPFMEALRLAREDPQKPQLPPRRAHSRQRRRNQEERHAEPPRDLGGGTEATAPVSPPPPASAQRPWRFGQAANFFASTTEAEQSDAVHVGPDFGFTGESGTEGTGSRQQANSKKKKKKKRRRKKGGPGAEGGVAQPRGKGAAPGGGGEKVVPGERGAVRAPVGGEAPGVAPPSITASIMAPVRRMLERLAADMARDTPEVTILFQGVLGLLSSIEGLLEGRAARR